MAALDFYFEYWLQEMEKKQDWESDVKEFKARTAYIHAYHAGFYDAVRQLNQKKLRT